MSKKHPVADGRMAMRSHAQAALTATVAMGFLAWDLRVLAALSEQEINVATFSDTSEAPAAWQVTIIDLGVLPGGIYSSAYGINDTGKIVGMAYDDNFQLQPVQWVDGQISVIPDLIFGNSSVPQDLNDAGEIAGTQSVSGFFSYAMYWDTQNNPSALPGLSNGAEYLNKAHAINAAGQVVGHARESAPNYYGHAVVWYQGALQSDLGFMGGGTSSEAFGINDLGAVVGAAAVATGSFHAFLWENGRFTDLSTWNGGSDFSKAFAINHQGAIVGLNDNVASIWENGAVHALPMPPGVSAYTPAIDINDSGDIIATGSKGYPFDVGVLWRNGDPIDLGTLPGGTISRARRINEAGEVVGEANAADGYFHAVKWIVTSSGGVDCAAIRNFSATCRRAKLIAKVVSSLPAGTALTVTRNGADARTLTINDRGKGKVKWTSQFGTQEACVVECPDVACASANCG